MLQTPFQKKMMEEHGNVRCGSEAASGQAVSPARQLCRGSCLTPHVTTQGRALLMDGTHGTNKYKFCLTTLMVIHKVTGHGIPVGWLIHSSQSEESLTIMLNAMADRMGDAFQPSVIIVDDAQAEINAIKGCKWCGTGNSSQIND